MDSFFFRMEYKAILRQKVRKWIVLNLNIFITSVKKTKRYSLYQNL